ncbi:SRPBCC family protein [Hymenobacter sp. B81]|uniref:SRPBCC family protein n=1 Tax=Hymenobacter sp. B81 TaxID=3344878 RepID=UPI0037DC0839
MKTLPKVALGLLAAGAGLSLIGLLLPRQVRVERTLTMQAPPAAVFNQINTLRNWEAWSPWHKIDPQMQLSYAGPAAGPGASYSWLSNHRQVGNGTLRIVRAQPQQRIDTEMNFDGSGLGYASYLLEPTAQGTKVTWSMESDMGFNPVGRYFGLFMDEMVGQDFERGLQNLRRVVETRPTAGR